MNSGRIFTEPRSGEVNILPLFTEIEKNNCFSIYTGVIPAKQFRVWEMSSLALHIRKTVQNSQTATFLLFNFVKGLAELTVITLFAL